MGHFFWAIRSRGREVLGRMPSVLWASFREVGIGCVHVFWSLELFRYCAVTSREAFVGGCTVRDARALILYVLIWAFGKEIGKLVMFKKFPLNMVLFFMAS